MMRVVRVLGVATVALFLWAGMAAAQSEVQLGEQEQLQFTRQGELQDADAIQLAQRSQRLRGGTHVYLLRGFLGVFSTGMDDLGAKLSRAGIRASVHSHTEFSSLADMIADAHKSGVRQNVVIIGHSLGANDALRMAERLGQYKITVPLIITYDPTASLPVPANVRRVVNFYSSANGWGVPLARGSGFRGSLSNVDLSDDPSMGHTEIDKSPRLHNRSIAYIRGSGGGGASLAPAAKTAPAKTPKARPRTEEEKKIAAETAAQVAAKPETAAAEKKDEAETVAAATVSGEKPEAATAQKQDDAETATASVPDAASTPAAAAAPTIYPAPQADTESKTAAAAPTIYPAPQADTEPKTAATAPAEDDEKESAAAAAPTIYPAPEADTEPKTAATAPAEEKESAAAAAPSIYPAPEADTEPKAADAEPKTETAASASAAEGKSEN